MATRNNPVSRIKFEPGELCPAENQVKIPAVIIAALTNTLVAFHNEVAGRRIWIAGNDAATIRLAAREFTNASSIVMVFIPKPPFSIL